MRLLEILRYQRLHRVDGNVYKFVQCDFAYSSNHIEGSTLTHDQTVSIFERGCASGTVRLDDAVEARNHFRLVDYVLDHADEPLDAEMLKHMHGILKRGTAADADPLQAVGGFKLFENEIVAGVARVSTAAPEEVPALVDALVADYEAGAPREGDFLALMARTHWRLERIHPFSDGNGRIGRAVMFKECLRHDETPFIVTEDLRDFYIRGLREFEREPGYLTDTLGFAQDRFEERYMPLARNYGAALERLGG